MPAILFVTSSRIGDAVLSSGVLAQLLAAHPGAAVTVACGPVAAALFADLPGLERLHVITRRRRGGHWWDLWKSVSGRRWTVVADLRGSLFPLTVRAAQRFWLRPQKRHEHRIEELARQLGLADLPAPHLWTTPERDAKAVAWLGDGPVLAMGPTANWGGKQWPAERFAELAHRLTAAGGILPGARLLVLGAPAERTAALPVLEALPADRVVDGTTLPDLLDVFAVLRRCSFYIGNDSGLMHLAAAAGIPTLGLFGPSPEWRYGPWGPKTAVVRTPERYEELVTDNPAFDHRSHRSLMTSLSIDAVMSGAEELWSRR